MFRLAVISFIALRVTLCPLFCADDLGIASAGDAVVANHCGCTTADSSTALNRCCGSSLPADQRSDCPDDGPCDNSCVCHAAPGLNERVAMADISWSFDLFAVDAVTVDLGKLAVVPSAEQSQRLDLMNGRAIRLVFASLLI